MNFTLCRVNTVLKRLGLELKPARTNGICTIKRSEDNRVVAAIHPVTRKFWIKTRSKQGKNGDFQIKPQPVMTFNDLVVWGQEALQY